MALDGADQAFVVMQIGAKDSVERKRADEIYRWVITPALKDVGITPYRADLDPSPGSITTAILSKLINSRLVIADLTGRNPNVYYELGIAHSFARPLISIVDAVDTIPFDTKDERVIELGQYEESSGLSYAQGESAKAHLLSSLRVILEDGYVPPSPLREVAGVQSLDQLAPSNPVASELGAMRETLMQIQRSVASPRLIRTSTASELAEKAQLRNAIESLIESGTVGINDLPPLINNDTSEKFDEWVRALEGRQYAASDPWASTAETNEDPWPIEPDQNTSDPWAQRGADEPPF